ncbi:MAG: DUF1080 domain-containing protein [Chloroflexia bacterium]|nr:DUF1080 domain-containing protein [Chloroflexia bacterium]
MSPRARWVVGVGLMLVAVVFVVLFVWGNPLGASPGRQDDQIDLERYETLKSQVEDLRSQGRDISYLDSIVADIEMWVAQDKVAEANLRIKDLEQALIDFDLQPLPDYQPQAPLPPAPAYAPVAAAGGTILLEEDFAAQGVLNAWQSAFLSFDPGNMAHWEQRQEALYLNIGAGGMQIVGMINVVGEVWSDYVYSVDIYPEYNLEIGLVIRYQDGAFYRFRFLNHEHGESGTRLLELVQGDSVTVLDQADGPGYQSGQWYNVQAVAEGPQLSVYLNGQLILEAQDATLEQGQIGVYALSLGDVYFDNVRVTSVR